MLGDANFCLVAAHPDLSAVVRPLSLFDRQRGLGPKELLVISLGD